MSKLDRPYNSKVLVDVYICTQRKDFVHEDFEDYYKRLSAVLQQLFDVSFDHNQMSIDNKIFWMLFNASIRSLLAITSPWSGFQEAGLLHRKLQEHPSLDKLVSDNSEKIVAANDESRAAHYKMIHALFEQIFGKNDLEVTSEELLKAGFDDSQEPDISDYLHLM